MNSYMFVGKHFIMDPETEDLLPASELQNGMVVLVESSVLRENPTNDTTACKPYTLDRLRKSNRWCEVSKVFKNYTGMETQVQFIGVYDDGTKASRHYGGRTGFYVKKDSMPEKETFPEPGKVVEDAISKNEIKTFGANIKVSDDIFEDHSIGTATGIFEDADGIKVEGTLTKEGRQELDEANKEFELDRQNESYGPTGSGVDEDDEDADDCESEEGPMVRALRRVELEPQLREKRTVNKTEVVEIYGPGRSVFSGPYRARRIW